MSHLKLGKLIIFLILFVLPGCSSSVPKGLNDDFNKIISISNMNSDLVVTELRQEQDQFGVNITVAAQNRSNNEIFLSTDPESPYVRTFVLTNEKWQEVKNNVIYQGQIGEEGAVLGSGRAGRYPSSVNPLVSPQIDLDPSIKQVLVRILVFGEFMQDGIRTGTQVGGYVDVLINR